MRIQTTIVTGFLFTALAAVALAQGGGGTEGTTIRPRLEEAKVKGCKIASPGEYKVSVGDLIELNYTYPIVPTAIPKKMSHTITAGGAVVKSSLGFRRVVAPKLVGAGTIAFYFEAKAAGEDTVTLTIDDAEYQYKFKVGKR